MRVFLYILIFVVLIPIALVLGVSLVLSNPDLYRDRVAQTFQTQTGLELSINGDIGWRFWPLIALNVNEIEIHSPHSDAPLAQLQRAAIDLELLPLLFGSDNIAIDGLSVDGLKVNLELGADGKGNWETASAQETTQAQPGEDEDQQTGDNTFNLDISSIEVTEAEIEYKDIGADQHYRVEITSLSTGRVAHDEPIDLQASLFLEDIAAKVSSRTDVSGQLSFNQNFDQFGFSALQLNSVVNVPDMPELAADVEISGSFDAASGNLTVDDTRATLNESVLKGNLSASLQEKTSVEFDFNVDRLNLNDYLPPDPESDAEDAGSSDQVADVEVIPSDMLNDYVIAGRFRIDEVLYDTYTFAPVDLVVNNKEQKLTAELTAQGYDGEFNMTFVANTVAQTNGTIDVDVTGLNVTQLTEWEWITGTFNAESATQFKGRMLSEVLDSIDGPTEFTIDDGTLDVTPIKNLAATIDKIRGKTSSISEWPDKMAFEHLDGQHELNDGIEANQVFGFQVENLKVAGTGGVDYWQNRLDYELQIMLDQTESGRFEVNERLAGVNWPLHCKGGLDESPVELCFADSGAVQNMVTEVAKQEVKREARGKVEEKIEEKVPENMREDARKLLKGLFDD